MVKISDESRYGGWLEIHPYRRICHIGFLTSHLSGPQSGEHIRAMPEPCARLHSGTTGAMGSWEPTVFQLPLLNALMPSYDCDCPSTACQYIVLLWREQNYETRVVAPLQAIRDSRRAWQVLLCLHLLSMVRSECNPAAKYEHPHQLSKLHPSAFINGYH